jgi:tetratricopeptide (TPR) repeat protein
VGSDRVDRERDSAGELAGLCGGLPIALRVAAARLATRPQRRVAWMVAEVRDEHRRLGALAAARGEVSVEAGFDLSYRELSPDAARAYRLLALHPGAVFGSGVAAACLGCAVAYAEGLLEELVEASMLADHAEDRYRLHDLQRVHALRRAELEESEQDRADAVRAMVGWYLDRAMAADTVVTPLRYHYRDQYRRPEQPTVFTDSAQGLDWLERELPNLVGSARAARDHGWHRLVWRLGEALWGLFLYRGHYREWIEVDRWGIEAGARCGDPVVESRMSTQLAAAYLRFGRPDTAAQWGQGALQRARAAGHWPSEASALETLGNAAHGQGRLPEALDYYQRALAVNEQHGRTRGVVLLLCCLGHLMRDQDDHAKALGYFRRAVDLAVGIGDRNSHAQALVGIGTTYARQGLFPQAAATMTEGLALLSPSTAPTLRVQVLHQIGEICLQGGDPATARTHWEQAVSMYAEQGDPRADQLRDRLRALPPA